MIKFTLKHPDTGRTSLYLGLSFANLDKFRAAPLDSFIMVKGEDLGIDIDIMLFSGESEGEMGRFIADRIGPDTKVHIDPRLRD